MTIRIYRLKNISQKQLLLGALALIFTILVGLVGIKIASGASLGYLIDAEQVSPTRDAFSNMSNGETDVANHYLISSNHGQAYRNQFGVYYLTDPTHKVIRFQRASSTDCSLSGKYGANVTLQLSTSRDTSASNTYTRNVGGSAACDASNPIYLSIPAGLATYDTSINRWKVIFTATVSCYLSDSFPDPPGNCSENARSPGADHAIAYRLAALASTNPDGGDGDVKIGSVEAGSKNYGILPDKRRNGYYTDAKFSFGLPCDSGSFNTAQPIRVYDADVHNDQAKQINFRIYKIDQNNNVSALDASEYSDVSGADPHRDGNGTRYFQPSEVTGTTNSTATVNVTMVKGMRYTLRVWNIWRPGTDGSQNGANPNAASRNNSNFLTVGVPGESIYGDKEFGCNYQLNPSIGDLNKSIDPGSRLNIKSMVLKTGIPDSEATNYQVTRIQYPNNTAFNTIDGYNVGDVSGFSDSPPCSGAVGGFEECVNTGMQRNNTDATFGSKTFTVDDPNVDIDNLTYSVPNSVGKRICFIVSVSWPSNSETHEAGKSWRHSKMECSIIAKRPKVQFLGNDLRVQGMIRASVSENMGQSGDRTFGSWIEYGVFSVGENETASSGAGLKGGSVYGLGEKNQWSGLTFANSTQPYGNYTPIMTPSTASYFAGLAASPWMPTTAVALPVESGVYDVGSSNIILNASDVNDKAKSIIIRTTGTVTIAGNINVPDQTYSDVKEISQVVISAGSINIRSNVGRIDAWLLSSSEIDTCLDKPTDGHLSTGDACRGALTVNGAIVTDKLRLYRTAGSEISDPGAPAETFNLRPSAYLWAYNYVNKQDRAQTVYLTELAPRL